MMGGGDAGQPRSHNQNVEMFKRHSYRRAAAPSAASILGFRTDKFAFANATFAGEAMTFAFAGMPLAASKAMRSAGTPTDRKSTRLNSSHLGISYAVFCLKKKK